MIICETGSEQNIGPLGLQLQCESFIHVLLFDAWTSMFNFWYSSLLRWLLNTCSLTWIVSSMSKMLNVAIFYKWYSPLFLPQCRRLWHIFWRKLSGLSFRDATSAIFFKLNVVHITSLLPLSRWAGLTAKLAIREMYKKED